MDEIKIPKIRVAVLIGKKGTTKRKIEESTKTKLDVSKEGHVIIEGESFNTYVAKLIIRAIGKGFNPDTAFTLLNEENILEVIEIKNYIKNSERQFKRVKGRLIGAQGKARNTLESLTNTDISILGKTIAIIGKVDDVDLARRAVEKLLSGSPHGKVYKFIETELKRRKIVGDFHSEHKSS